MTPQELDLALLNAVKTDNLELVETLINQGANVNQVDENGNGLLHIARNKDIVSLLIDANADTNLQNNQGQTPLHVQARHNFEICQELLTYPPIENEADVNRPDKQGRTPLFFAKDPQTARIILDSRADVNHVDENGNTALHYVTDIEMAKVLIEHGADLNIKNNDGLTPLDTIKDDKIHEFITQNMGSLVQKQLNNSLLTAVRTGNIDKIKSLIDQGADINHVNTEGKTLLHFAETPEMAEVLLNHGVNPNQGDNTGITALHVCKSPEMAEVLINHGAKVNQGDNTGNTPLHVCKSPEIAEVLLNHGAKVNQGDNTGNTPLHWCDSPEMAEVLVNHGANVNQGNNAGVTALHWCNSPEMAEVLLNHGANVNQGDNTGVTALHVCESPEIAEVLINHGANVNQGDKIGLTALHHAQKPEMVQFLINNGANVNQGADDGRTPLFFAKDPQIAQILINSGANVNHKDNYGNTTLHQVTDIEIAKLLVASGANINHQNQAGLTPLDMCQDKEIREYLIQNGAKKGNSNHTENQVANVNTNLLQTPTEPEYGHLATPVPDSEIRDFLNNDLKIEPVTDESKETMFKALKEVCRTPTGCMAFRATRANIKAQRENNPDYHLDVTLSEDTDVDYFGCVLNSEPNHIYIQTKNIQNSYPDDTGEADFQIGSTFLHEAMHVRQNQNPLLQHEPNSTITDAPTSALTRQIAVESPYPSIQRREHISSTEQLAYEQAIGLKPDGSYDAVAAQRYSAHMQQIYTREFLKKPGEQPLVNYTSINRQIGYMQTDTHHRLLYNYQNAPSSASYTDLETRYGTSVEHNDLVQNQITNALAPLAKPVQEKLNSDQTDALFNAVCQGDETLDENLFPKGSEARQVAEAYLTTSNDINDKLTDLSYYSKKIYDNPNDMDALNESSLIRQELREKYNIDIPTHNITGERVATNVEEETQGSFSQDENPLHPTTDPALNQDVEARAPTSNRTLAQNSNQNITNTPKNAEQNPHVAMQHTYA